MPPVTAPNVTITKTDRGMTHAPPGNPVTIPNGGTITICNRRRRRNTRVRVTMDDEETFSQLLRPGDCVTLTVGSPQVPDGQYSVVDPPSILKIIGIRGSTFTFKK